MVRALRLVERGPALRQWLKTTTGSRASFTPVSACPCRLVHHDKDLSSPRSGRYLGSNNHAMPHQQRRTLHTEVSRVLGSEEEATLDELKALAVPHQLAKMDASDVMAWFRKWAAVCPMPSPCYVHPMAVEARRVIERAVEILSVTTAGQKEVDPGLLCGIPFHCLQPSYRLLVDDGSADAVKRMVTAALERSMEVGLRHFSASQLGEVMEAMALARYRDPVFFKAMEDECLRRGLQTFRAGSLGQLMYGMGRKSGYTPSQEFLKMCVERSSKRGFLTRDCTPTDIGFMMWGYKTLKLTPSPPVLEGVASLCTKADFLGQLQLRDLSYILLSLKDLYVGILREAAACSLYDEVRRRATADERGFRFRMLAGMLVNARQTYFSTQAVDESVRPFVQAVYADVARHEPGDYPSGALINLVVAGARLGVLQDNLEPLLESALKELVRQGVGGCTTSELTLYLGCFASLPRGPACRLADGVLAVLLSREDLWATKVRLLFEGLRTLHARHGYSAPGLDAHVERLWGALTKDRAKISPRTVTAMLYTLGALHGKPGGRSEGPQGQPGVGTGPRQEGGRRLRVELVDDMVSSLGHSQLIIPTSKQRCDALQGMRWLCEADADPQLWAIEDRLHCEVWAMWAKVVRHPDKTQGALQRLSTTSLGHLLRPRADTAGELECLLSGLLHTSAIQAGSTRTVLISIVSRCVSPVILPRLCVSSLHGLLLGLLEASRRGAVTKAMLDPLVDQLVRRLADHPTPSLRLLVDLGKAHYVVSGYIGTEASRAYLVDTFSVPTVLAHASPADLRDILRSVGSMCGAHVPPTLAASLTTALQSSDPSLMDVGALYGIVEKLAYLELPDVDHDYVHRVLVASRHHDLTKATIRQLQLLLRLLAGVAYPLSKPEREELNGVLAHVDPSELRPDNVGPFLVSLSKLGLRPPTSVVSVLFDRTAPLLASMKVRYLDALMFAARVLHYQPSGPFLDALRDRCHKDPAARHVAKRRKLRGVLGPLTEPEKLRS